MINNRNLINLPIDGVALCAMMNQQRERSFKSAKKIISSQDKRKTTEILDQPMGKSK